MAKTKKAPQNMGKIWTDHIRVLLVSAVLASIANTIYLWCSHGLPALAGLARAAVDDS